MEPGYDSRFCKAEGCNEVRNMYWFTDYCEKFHRCREPDCNRMRKPMSYYCDNHCCLFVGCDSFRLTKLGSTYNYCELHACEIIGCFSEKIANLEYCSNHKCISEHCINFRPFRGKGYCANCIKKVIVAMTVIMKRLKVGHDMVGLVQGSIMRTFMSN
jgi:hypothetical protein